MRQYEDKQHTDDLSHKIKVQHRIDQLIGKTKDKMKLGHNKKEDRFNERLKILKEVPTFVDIQKSLQALNMIDDPLMLHSLEMKKNRLEARLELEQQLKLKEGMKETFQRYQKQNNMEIAIINNDICEYYDKLKYVLQLTNDNISTLARKDEFILNQGLSNGYQLIQKTKDRINSRKQQIFPDQINNEFLEKDINDQLYDEQQLKDQQKIQFNEGLEFYLSTLADFEKQQFLQQQKQFDQQNKKTDFEYQVKEFNQYLKENGITLNHDEIIPNQTYFKNFRSKASLLIRKANENSKGHQSQTKLAPITEAQQKIFNKTKELLKTNQIIFKKYKRLRSPIVQQTEKKSLRQIPLPKENTVQYQTVIDQQQRKSIQLTRSQKIAQSSLLTTYQLSVPKRGQLEPESSSKISPFRSKSVQFLQTIGDDLFKSASQVPLKSKNNESLKNSQQLAKSFENLQSRINKESSQLEMEQLNNQVIISTMNNDLLNTFKKYPTSNINSLKLEKDEMSNYLKLTQKLRQSNLFRKKNNQQQILRKQKIFKSQVNQYN